MRARLQVLAAIDEQRLAGDGIGADEITHSAGNVLGRAIAAKGGVVNLTKAMAWELGEHGIRVNTICPTFVETPMTAKNTFKMPMIIPAGEAAERLLQGLEGNRFEIAFPRRFAVLMKMLRRLPYPVFFWLVRRYILRR